MKQTHKKVIGEFMGITLRLLVLPNTDIQTRFKGYCIDTERIMSVNGAAIEFYEVKE